MRPPGRRRLAAVREATLGVPAPVGQGSRGPGSPASGWPQETAPGRLLPGLLMEERGGRQAETAGSDRPRRSVRGRPGAPLERCCAEAGDGQEAPKCLGSVVGQT